MIAQIAAHVVDGERRYPMGEFSFTTEDVLMEALRKAGKNPEITDTGISFTVEEADILGQEICKSDDNTLWASVSMRGQWK